MQLAPVLLPLDKDLVKALLRCLRNPAFQGSAALLAALAGTGAGERRGAEGLLRVRAGPAPRGLPCVWPPDGIF
jgi:hypothetical protein